MLKAVIFDCGGVVHSQRGKKGSELVGGAFNLTAEQIKPYMGPIALDLSIGKINEREFWEKLALALEMPVPLGWEKVWGKAIEDDKAYPEITELVDKLKSRGIKAVILSNTVSPHGELIKKLGWYKPFDKIYLSYEIGFRKPDIRAYQLVLDDLKINGKDAVMIDNLEENLVPARELGMKTILASNPVQVKDQVEALLIA